MPWLVQYKVAAPIVKIQDAQSYAIQISEVKKVKQLAVLSKQNNTYAVELIVPSETKIIDFNKLNINKQPNAQYYLVAIGLQNQLSDLVLL